MSAAAEHRYQKRQIKQAHELARAEREQEIAQLDATGAYDARREAESALRALDGALLCWKAPRPALDYATKREAQAAAKQAGPGHIPVRSFTNFESFWVVVFVGAYGWIGVGAIPYTHRLASDEEVAAMSFKTLPTKPVYIVTLAF